ncbi:MAG: hypothetical protein A2315_16535 [Ignavibacteria bacterium RIFOXYB2_FULL_35_12]|nr:MAG: hypothetical protein A2058_09865 [Ignavibacteria bacterium GWA2_36_19]OGU62793.1 MAG: hypothetical protein A2X60_04430 [Ignavibacteria bacterium GWF2_35_20]OGU79256.1 MAG: hypothetical protein A2254_09140 [Ignavibacteria bacterium RIFOXYA2_FULL_35_9]OGU87305.1 MAG: hypothetical protein A3K31_10235 [Ignavibacteria bacterium RIFOXYA12_FULL_35_25]OGU91123.1 MAG: hypothetical protein A2492_02055 [Ignavibacteria bacterium RIFOXYC12_FULL_35_11]OGU97541.1 MAG: hypothetical protein A2347_09530
MEFLSSMRYFALHGWIGIFLIIIFWFLNWFLDGLRTQWGFFPLWLGYCLTIDALVLKRRGTSLLTRSPKKYIGLFLVSAPSWWLFELFNSHLKNWQYIGKENFTNFEYALLASLSFSTVIPAVFGSAELASSFNWIKKIRIPFRLKNSSTTLLVFFTLGIFLLISILKWPDVFYPFVWITIFLLIEPFNIKRGFSSLLNFAKEGNWQPVISLSVGCLICAFFWEMWNVYSYPKWIYNLPHVNTPKLFEMPFPGYVGYIPFSFEIFTITSFVYGVTKTKLTDYLQIGQ